MLRGQFTDFVPNAFFQIIILPHNQPFFHIDKLSFIISRNLVSVNCFAAEHLYGLYPALYTKFAVEIGSVYFHGVR